MHGCSITTSKQLIQLSSGFVSSVYSRRVTRVISIFMQCGQNNQVICYIWQCFCLCLYDTRISEVIIDVLS